jgi:leucyl-tRNA synthetase
VEAGWYDWWKASGYFSPAVHSAANRKKMEKKRFSLVLPPPNVTGVLHLGHALTATVQVQRYRSCYIMVLFTSGFRIRINLSCWIRIRIQIADPDPETNADPKPWSRI